MGLFTRFKKKTADESDIQKVTSLVNACVYLEPRMKISPLLDKLKELDSLINQPGGGKLITDFPDKENLGICFAFMLHYLKGQSSLVREIWAQEGFYCFIEYLDHQRGGRRGQAEANVLFFTLLCVGRDLLKPKIQDVIDKVRAPQTPFHSVFHADDYAKGAQHVLDQISLFCVSCIHDLGESAVPIMMKITQRYNGFEFFEQTIRRRDLLVYDPHTIIDKERFIRDSIELYLTQM